jgi:hypothetical protein
MRIEKSLCLLAGLGVGLVGCLTPALPAQEASQGVVITGGGSNLNNVPREPYSATQKTTMVQTLADGTKITHETTTKIARDSNGRIYRETHALIPANDDGEFATVTVFDPVNRVSITWNTRTKIATVFHIPTPEQVRANEPVAPTVQATAQPPVIHDPAPQIEKLGTQTINGVVAEGKRMTRVIPAGRQGNDQPITITLETWWSPELKLMIRQIQDDPRSGLHTTELSDIQQGEPDPALFQVPEGYTVKDRYPDQQSQN